METTYYKTDAGYIAVTNQCPRGFKGALYVGRDEDGVETAYSPIQLSKLKPVAVEDVPASVVRSFGYDTVEDFPLLDEEGENLVAYIHVREPVRPVYQPAKNSRFWYDIGLLIGLAAGICLICFFL